MRLANLRKESGRWTHTAIQSCVSTALRDVPTELLTLRRCLIHLKNSSTCHLDLQVSAMVAADSLKLVVRRTQRLPASGSLNPIRRNGWGQRFLPRTLVSSMAWSLVTPRLRRAGLTGCRSSTLCRILFFMRVTRNPPCKIKWLTHAKSRWARSAATMLPFGSFSARAASMSDFPPSVTP